MHRPGLAIGAIRIYRKKYAALNSPARVGGDMGCVGQNQNQSSGRYAPMQGGGQAMTVRNYPRDLASHRDGVRACRIAGPQFLTS
jgi:hypothetical protein